MIIVPGFTSDDKVPGVVAVNTWGAGKQSIGAIPLACVLYGNKTSSGAAALNTRTFITTPEEADAAFGARSELGRMLTAALDVPGVTLYGVANLEVVGGTAATLIIDIGGSWTTAGEIPLQLDEEVIRVAVAASYTPTTFGDALVAAINGAQNGRMFCVASNVAGRVTLTVQNLGVRGNFHLGFLDTSLKPSGMTIAFDQLSDVVKAGTGSGPAMTATGADVIDGTYVLTISTGGTNSGTAQYTLTFNGGSPTTPATLPSGNFALPGHTGITINAPAGTYVVANTYTFTGVAALANGGVPFSGGAGTDDIEDALDGTESVTNDYVAVAQNDVTNVGKVEAAINAKAAFDVGRLEQYVVARTRGLSDAIALGQAGMNDQLGTCAWIQNHVEHPSLVAARLAALFSVTDGAQPNTNYDDRILPGAAPQRLDSDVPNRSTLKSALNNGITPLVTVDGKIQIICAICSRSLNGSTPDYRTFDHGQVAVPIRVRKELVQLGRDMKDPDIGNNQWCGPDIEDQVSPQGVITPRQWNSRATQLLKSWETDQFNWLTEVDDNLPQSEYQSGPPARIMSIVPTVVKPLFHQLGIVVRQQAAG